MSLMPKVTAHFIRCLAVPLKWLANGMLFVLFLMFFFFLLSGNELLSFLNRYTLTLVVGAIGGMVLNVWLKDYAERLLNSEYKFAGFPKIFMPSLPNENKLKQPQTTNETSQSSKVINMSDYR